MSLLTQIRQTALRVGGSPGYLSLRTPQDAIMSRMRSSEWTAVEDVARILCSRAQRE